MGSQELTLTRWPLPFSEDYITNIILPNTNKNLDNKLCLCEFVRYIGIWLFIMNHSLKHCIRYFWSPGIIVALDFGLCVLKALLKLKEHGVYAIAIIKKRRYWPWGVDGDKLTTHFLSSSVGDSELIMVLYNRVYFNLV